MYALVVSQMGEEDVVKVSTTADALYSLAEEKILSYIKDRKLKKSGDVSTILNLLKCKDYDSAMDMFGATTEKAGEAIFMVLMKAELIYDA